jgi:hypothetical protein
MNGLLKGSFPIMNANLLMHIKYRNDFLAKFVLCNLLSFLLVLLSSMQLTHQHILIYLRLVKASIIYIPFKQNFGNFIISHHLKNNLFYYDSYVNNKLLLSHISSSTQKKVVTLSNFSIHDHCSSLHDKNDTTIKLNVRLDAHIGINVNWLNLFKYLA